MKLNFNTLFICLLVLIVIVLASLQLIPFEWISKKVNELTPDNDASSWNLDLYNQIRFNAIFAIILLVGVITFLIVKINALNRWTNDIGYFIIEQLHKCVAVFKSNSFNQNISLIVIGVIAGFSRFMLFNDPITYDEAFSANQYVSSSFLNIVSNYNYPNNHVFYNLINKFSSTFIGSYEQAIRLPAFIAGMLCLPFSFVLGNQLFKNFNKAAFLTSLIAFSPLLIEYSVLARGYSFIWLMSICSLIAINAYITSKEIRYLTLFIILNILSIWTVPVAILPFIILLLYLAYKTNVIIPFKMMIITLIGAALVYLPILLIYGVNLSSKVNLGVEESFTRLFNYHMEHSFYDFYYNFIMTKPIYFGFSALIFIITLIKKHNYKHWVLFTCASIILVMLFQKTIPPARVWSVVLIFLYIPMSNTLGELFSKSKLSSLLFAPLFLLIIQLIYNQKKTFIMTHFRYESAEIVVSRISEPTTIICAFPMEAPLKFYWKNYLRDINQFNVVGDNLMVVVSLKHKQTVHEVCAIHNVNPANFILTFQNKETEVYQLGE